MLRSGSQSRSRMCTEDPVCSVQMIVGRNTPGAAQKSKAHGDPPLLPPLGHYCPHRRHAEIPSRSDVFVGCAAPGSQLVLTTALHSNGLRMSLTVSASLLSS